MQNVNPIMAANNAPQNKDSTYHAPLWAGFRTNFDKEMMLKFSHCSEPYFLPGPGPYPWSLNCKGVVDYAKGSGPESTGGNYPLMPNSWQGPSCGPRRWHGGGGGADGIGSAPGTR